MTEWDLLCGVIMAYRAGDIPVARAYLEQHAENRQALVLEKDIAGPEEWALWLPRRTSDHHEGAIVMFLDEFQNTHLPQHNFDIVGVMQEAVESPTCHRPSKSHYFCSPVFASCLN